MLKVRLVLAEVVGGEGDSQAGEGSRRVLGARGRATSALAAAARGLELALPGAFPSTTPPRLFDQPSYPLKTQRSQTHRSRASASPRSRPQRSRRWSTATRGQQKRRRQRGSVGMRGSMRMTAPGQHDEGREMGDHGRPHSNNAIRRTSETTRTSSKPTGRRKKTLPTARFSRPSATCQRGDDHRFLRSSRAAPLAQTLAPNTAIVGQSFAFWSRVGRRSVG